MSCDCGKVEGGFHLPNCAIYAVNIWNQAQRLNPALSTAENIAIYKAQLAHEQQMADTVAVGSDEELRLLVAANNKLHKDNVVLTRRIEELEATLTIENDRNNYGMEYRQRLLDRQERIAAVLKTFYYAELSLSAIQPIIALCLELNNDIVEHKR